MRAIAVCAIGVAAAAISWLLAVVDRSPGRDIEIPWADDLHSSPPDEKAVAAWPLDMRLDVAIESIVELRGRAARGDLVAQTRLGPELDAEEARLWRERAVERERLAMARLSREGIIGMDAAPPVEIRILVSRLGEIGQRMAWQDETRRYDPRPTSLEVDRRVRRERALDLAEMAILRRLIAASSQ